MGGVARRTVVAVAASAAAGFAGGRLAARASRLPLSGGSAPAADPLDWTVRGQTQVVWHVDTDEPAVALTFDDGPAPQWTPMVLDTLDRHAAPATFFVVGERLAAHRSLVDGRLDRHEVGNHTWSHTDLATMDLPDAEAQLRRTHEVIKTVTGREPRLVRPPWGHLGGAALRAADRLGYDVALWSQAMPEREYAADPPGLARAVVAAARPGAILLAHDVGAEHRLIALRQLDAIITGLRAKGLRLVTISELFACVRARSK